MKSEINILVLFAIIFIHWIADFVFQTDKMAKGKSKNWSDLLAHTITYSACWIPFAFFRFGYSSSGFIMFPLITFIAHTITDYITSRVNSRLLAKGDTHNFFVSVGFDQILHYVQLILTYQFFSN